MGAPSQSDNHFLITVHTVPSSKKSRERRASRKE
jgi:hypothetical protein